MWTLYFWFGTPWFNDWDGQLLCSCLVSIWLKLLPFTEILLIFCCSIVIRWMPILSDGVSCNLNVAKINSKMIFCIFGRPRASPATHLRILFLFLELGTANDWPELPLSSTNTKSSTGILSFWRHINLIASYGLYWIQKALTEIILKNRCQKDVKMSNNIRKE